MADDLIERLRTWSKPIPIGAGGTTFTFEPCNSWPILMNQAADEIESLTAKVAALTVDAERYRAMLPYLKVVRDEPSDWACWVEFAGIPFRSRTDDPRELADKLVAIIVENRVAIATKEGIA